MDSSLNASRENSDLLKGADLKTNDWLAFPTCTKDVQDDATTMENIHMYHGEEPIMRHPLVQITNWDSQTLASQDVNCLKHSRYRLGGSADNILSLTSCQSVPPLEWKVLRSSRSQDTLAHFSGVTQECIDGGHKQTSDNNQDTVDDIIGNEVAFKRCPHVFKNNQAVAYTANFRTAFPIQHIGSSTSKNAHQCLNGSEYLPLQHPRGEKLLEVGMQVNQPLSSAVDQDSSLIGQVWTPAASPKNLYNNTSPSTSLECHASNQETRESLVQSEFLQNLPIKIRQERKDMKKVQTKGQLLFKGQSLHLADNGKHNSKAENIFNKEECTHNLLKSECNSPIILHQVIVNLKNQISDLHKANKTAALELANADEEISQLKDEMALLKSEYSQKLADYTEENLILKKKINRIHNRQSPVDTYEQALHEEICELRSESRRLREISHQLNEENHRLKELLRDVKRQYEWLIHTNTGKQDESLQERYRNNASPSSINSESTEMLIAGYCDAELAKENKELKDSISEENTKMNGNKNSEQNISSSSSNSFSHVDAYSKYSANRIHMDKSPLSRRPFAPRSIADLKVGNLVKFSQPAGRISKGTVRYLGPLFGREEDYLGIELEGDQVGRHDGVFQGTRYFLW
ncbi:hypothetical protein JD844_032521 [Phrynosoma platyrhinos]|uniref:CAP-Gly domain-containing protein n=1 Tax=Phrynosoma platyrhinos TaxID=52577 RepID=A0ABQ7T5K1_PHRPL|nr:hypothetical protein JD844_032521 [Phrynosoma platyrhinos]